MASWEIAINPHKWVDFPLTEIDLGYLIPPKHIELLTIRAMRRGQVLQERSPQHPNAKRPVNQIISLVRCPIIFGYT